MGLTHVDVTLKQLTGKSGGYTSKFLVETGATDTLAPASELTRLGIEPEGTRHKFSFGFVRVEIMGMPTVEQVVFAPEGTEPLLGVTVLEHLGLVVDPVSNSLKRLPAVPLK